MSVCDIPLLGTVCDAAESAGGAVIQGVGAWLARTSAELAKATADLAVRGVDATTRIDLNAAWFREDYGTVLAIGLVLTVGTFCLQLLRAAWRRDDGALVQAVSGTVVGVLFSFAVVSLTTVALTVVDALCDGLFALAGTSLKAAVRRSVLISELGGGFGLTWAVPALLGLLLAVGAIGFWGVMLFRKVGILILVTLAVFAGAGGGWEAARKWRRGWIEATATLVFSKLLMTVVFLLGISAIGKVKATDGVTALSDVLSGLLILLLVLLCPFATYRFVRWAGEDGGGESVHRGGGAGPGTVAGAAQKAGTLALQAGAGGAGGAAGAAGTTGAGGGAAATGGIDPAGGDGGGLTPDPLDALPEEPKRQFRFGQETGKDGTVNRPLLSRPGAGNVFEPGAHRTAPDDADKPFDPRIPTAAGADGTDDASGPPVRRFAYPGTDASPGAGPDSPDPAAGDRPADPPPTGDGPSSAPPPPGNRPEGPAS